MRKPKPRGKIVSLFDKARPAVFTETARGHFIEACFIENNINTKNVQEREEARAKAERLFDTFELVLRKRIRAQVLEELK